MKTRTILSLLFSLLLAVFVGPAVASSIGVDSLKTIGALFGASLVPMQQAGILTAGIYREVWANAVKEALENRDIATHLSGFTDFSQYVASDAAGNQTIHMNLLGVLPEVLIDNTTYPIEYQEQDGDDVPIGLNKFQTKVTPITDDELYALTYDKMALTAGRHQKSISIIKNEKFTHAIAPSTATATMPVLLTTGEDDGTGRKRLTRADLIALKLQCDKLKWPKMGRRLVLCGDHENDILSWEEKFKDQFANLGNGTVVNLLGFEFHSYTSNPYYTVSTKAKLAFGAVPDAALATQASVCFLTERIVSATGYTKAYISLAVDHPETQQNGINYRHYAIVMPVENGGRAAIISDFVPDGI